ncbi:MAG: thioredoxin family protein [Promethearchaeota archaeon]
MFSTNEIENIKRGMEKLKDDITIKLFTDYKNGEDGNKLRKCMACEGIFNLLQTLSELSNNKLKIEEISTEENQDIAEKYNVVRIPTILFMDKNEKEVIRYTANPTGPELAPFIETLQYFSGVNSYYRDVIASSLKKIEKSIIKLFITLTCPYCPGIVPLLNLVALLSKGKIKVEIIDINMNPDIALKYNVQGVPHTLINEKDQISGMVTLQDILEKLTKGKRDFDGMYS